MSDRSEKRPLTKMLWSVSIKTRTFASVNKSNGSFLSCLKLLKQYRTIEQMCSDAHSIILSLNSFEMNVTGRNMVDVYVFRRQLENIIQEHVQGQDCTKLMVFSIAD